MVKVPESISQRYGNGARLNFAPFLPQIGPKGRDPGDGKLKIGNQGLLGTKKGLNTFNNIIFVGLVRCPG